MISVNQSRIPLICWNWRLINPTNHGKQTTTTVLWRMASKQLNPLIQTKTAIILSLIDWIADVSNQSFNYRLICWFVECGLVAVACFQNGGWISFAELLDLNFINWIEFLQFKFNSIPIFNNNPQREIHSASHCISHSLFLKAGIDRSIFNSLFQIRSITQAFRELNLLISFFIQSLNPIYSFWTQTQKFEVWVAE